MVKYAVSYEAEFWDDINDLLHKEEGCELVEAKNLFKALRVVLNKLQLSTPFDAVTIYMCCGTSTYSWVSPNYEELKERDAETRLQ